MKDLLRQDTPQGQRDAITADDRTITVTAGAGTGKTWVLTQRYLRLLLDDDELLPSEILTLTYTEAAADEMKSRITKAIEGSQEQFADPERRRNVLDGLSDMWISTIHSFAARLIRESGLSLDIDPRASVITAQQEEEFWESIRTAAEFARLGDFARHYGNKTLRKIADELDESDDFSFAVAKWKAGTLADFAKDTAELHASSGRTWEEMLGWAENDVLIDKAKPLVNEILKEDWRDVCDFWDKVYPLPEAKKGTKGANLNEFLDIRKTITEREFYTGIMTSEDFSGARNVKPAIGCGLGDWRKSRSQKILEATNSFDSDLTEQELRVRKILLKFCALCWGLWDTMKVKRGLLSFSDMINHARTAISEKGINRTFKHILVDEFQDTDPLQFQMITSLVGENTKFFAVGDPKQSIYRFRHADPALFAETIKKSNKTVHLDTSFRTRASLLSRINQLFASIWIDGLGKSNPMNSLSYEPLDPKNSGTERSIGTMPDFTAIIAQDSKGTLSEARKNLADNLARKIHDWVNEGRTIWDKEAGEKDNEGRPKGALRPVKFSDFAILTPSRGIFDTLEKALTRFGIKSIRDRSENFFSRGEINDIVCLLRASADMNDDFAVSGWLMSPFSGVEEEDAVKCLTLAGKDSRPIELIRTNFPEAYSRLEYYALVGEVEGPAGLISIFDRNRSWLASCKPDERLRILQNIRLAVQIARDFQHSGTAGLKSCAEWLTRAVRDNLSYEEPAWHDKDENAVRLGSVHSAKGLEYPVTIVFDQRNQKRSETKSLRPSRELGLVFTDIPDEIPAEKDFKPKLASWEKLLSDQGEAEEQERLFYVSCTRAQDSLVYCGLVKDNGDLHNDTWTKLLFENCDNLEYDTADEITEQVSTQKEEQDSAALIPVERVKIRTPLRQISASSFSIFEWCPFAWRRIYRQGLTLKWEDPGEKAEDYDGRTGGAELGSLAHWILARWLKEDNYAERLEYWLTDKEVISQLPGHLRSTLRLIWKKGKEWASLREWLINFAESDLGIMIRTQKFKPEEQFRHPLNEKTIMAGAIDAVSGDTVIDYKITSIDRTPPGLYESQLDFYAFVWHEKTGAESVKSVIAFLREGKTAERVIDDFEGIRARIEHAAEACGSGPYTPKHEHCGVCPFRKGCVNIGVHER